MKTLIGMITFGNLQFTQLAINEIKRTTKSEVEFLVILGKPDDVATRQWLMSHNIRCLMHRENWGMSASANDIYDYAFVRSTYWIEGNLYYNPGAFDAVIFVGNDVVVYPGAIDALIAEAARGEYDWVCASEYDVRSLCRDYPAARQFFTGDNYQFTDFATRPWDLHAPSVPQFSDPLTGMEANCRKDTYNLCLYTRRAFEQLGYMDWNFWPNGYFADNDWGYRGDLDGVKACGLRQACYFHFWSRTIHQGVGARAAQFQRNQAFYVEKWGGLPGQEKFRKPFNRPELDINLRDRTEEIAQVKKWMAM